MWKACTARSRIKERKNAAPRCINEPYFPDSGSVPPFPAETQEEGEYFFRLKTSGEKAAEDGSNRASGAKRLTNGAKNAIIRQNAAARICLTETGAFFRARELIKSRKLLFADQSAIVRSTSKKKMLPQKFNDQKFLHKSTVVRHFSKRLFYFPYPHVDNIKQWNVEKVRSVFGYREFDDILDEYLALKTGFGEEQGGAARRIVEAETKIQPEKTQENHL